VFRGSPDAYKDWLNTSARSNRRGFEGGGESLARDAFTLEGASLPSYQDDDGGADRSKAPEIGTPLR